MNAETCAATGALILSAFSLALSIRTELAARRGRRELRPGNGKGQR